MRREKILLLLLLFSCVANAQKRKLDSLLHELSVHTQNDKTRLRILNALPVVYLTMQPTRGESYAREALRLAAKLEDKEQLAIAYANMATAVSLKSDYKAMRSYALKAYAINKAISGDVALADLYLYSISYTYSIKGIYQSIADLKKARNIYSHGTDYLKCGYTSYSLGIYYRDLNPDSSRHYLQEAISFHQKSGDQCSEALAWNALGATYKNTGDYATAYKYLSYSLALNIKNETWFGLYVDYTNFGFLYTNLSDFSRAIAYYTKALKLTERMEDLPGQAINLCSIGESFNSMGKHREAVKYLNRSLKIATVMKLDQIIATDWSELANVYMSAHRYDSAIAYYKGALGIAERTDDRLNEAYCRHFLAKAYLKVKNYKAAIIYVTEATPIIDEVKDKWGIAENHIILAQVISQAPADILSSAGFSSFARETLVTHHLIEALSLAKSNDVLELQRNALQELGNFYEKKGDLQNFSKYYRQYVAIKDSILNADVSKSVALLQIQYETEKKERQIALLKSQAEVDRFNARRRMDLNYGLSLGLMAMMAVAFLFYRENLKRKKTNLALAEEKQRSDDLLLNILPAEVADELKQYGASKAKNYDEVTVLFTDFVDFTKAGERMTPQQLVDELHNCFRVFDEIISKYNIEKIKTIGDAYLAVGGLPVADEQHTHNVVKAAIEIREFMVDRKQKLGDNTFEIRIGIHSGPVVAGIVGVKKFAYDIWGDTVNTAARMEQASEQGKINISETTYERIKGSFDCIFRGEIAAKNKGIMRMYFVRQLSSTVVV